MAMSEIDRIIEGCTECELCVVDCEFLKEACQNPKELAERFSSGYFKENPRLPYSCNLCALCERLCPDDLDIGKMCLEIRRQLVEEGLGPLPSHRRITEEQEWISANFTLAMPDPDTGECNRIFFPGCNLSGYSPSLVINTYDYLRKKLPGTGIILGCCGNPVYCLGEISEFQTALKSISANMKQLGASELIVACPECYHTLENLGHFRLTSLYEVLAEQGIPDPCKQGECTFSLHDSCPTRYEETLQESVRTLVRGMGYQIEEMEYSRDKTRCCGMGGMIAYADLKLSNRIIKKRAAEAKHDVLTYCASCREAFGFLGKPSLHILVLIFNPDWEQDRIKPAKLRVERRENQVLLKSRLETI